MTIADDAMAARAGAIIARWGQPAQLLRGSDLRDCTAAILDYSPRARGLALEGAERLLIAAPLDIPPDHELDKVVLGGALYQIPTPVKGPRPGGIAIYFDLDIVYESLFEAS